MERKSTRDVIDRYHHVRDDDEVATLRWPSISGDVMAGDSIQLRDGADTFIVRDDKIVVQRLSSGDGEEPSPTQIEEAVEQHRVRPLVVPPALPFADNRNPGFRDRYAPRTARSLVKPRLKANVATTTSRQ